MYFALGQRAAIAFAERLPHGSLFIMAGDTRRNFRPEVPKAPDVPLPRINRHSAHSAQVVSELGKPHICRNRDRGRPYQRRSLLAP